MNKSTLCFFTSTFPYGDGEAFIGNEIKYLNNFSNVIIIPVNATSKDKKKIRKIDLENYKIFEVNGDSINIWQTIKYTVCTVLRKEFWRECKKAHQKKGLWGLFDLLKFTAIGEHRVSQVKHRIKEELSDKFEDCLIYSYWLHLPLYIALRCFDSKQMVVSRCHGFDLYEERNDGYLPYRDYFFRNATYIVSVSENGTNYLKKKYPQFKNKFLCSRLGTSDHGIEVEKTDESLSVISCSRLVNIKRVELIVEALSELSAQRIHWTHIGDGPLNKKIQNSIKTKLEGSNVYISWLGEISNEDVISYYMKNYFDCFINVSSTEGIPVSIMEAISFGIPIIATNVGGTAEVVKDGYNGYLLDCDFDIQELVDRIQWFIDNKESTDNRIMRTHSRMMWDERCNGEKNYKEFLELFNQL